MKKSAPVLISVLVLIATAMVLAGCAATYTGIRYGELKVQNKMSATIFLDPVPPAQRTVFVQVRNTSDKPFNLQQDVAAALAAKGYRVVQNPRKAHYWLQANVLQVGMADEAALEKARVAGFGGVAAGAGVGALIAGSGHRGTGALVGGLVAGAAEMISGAAVKVITYMVVTDLQISERVRGPVSQQFHSGLRQGTGNTRIRQDSASSGNMKKYQTRIVSSARKTGLTFEEAYPPLRHGIANAIAGIL